MWRDVITRRVASTIAVVLFLILYIFILNISDDVSVLDTPSVYNITDDRGHVVATFPAANYMNSFLGMWSFVSSKGHDWVRFTGDAEHPMEVYDEEASSGAGMLPEPCPAEPDDEFKDKVNKRNRSSSDALCVIWREREKLVSSEPIYSRSPVFVFPTLELDRQKPILIWRLLFQNSMALRISSNSIIFRGAQANWTADMDYWYAFGFTEGNSHDLRSLFSPNDTYTLGLVDGYIKNSLDGLDSIRLFARVYQEQQRRRRRAQDNSSTTGNSSSKSNNSNTSRRLSWFSSRGSSPSRTSSSRSSGSSSSSSRRARAGRRRDETDLPVDTLSAGEAYDTPTRVRMSHAGAANTSHSLMLHAHVQTEHHDTDHARRREDRHSYKKKDKDNDSDDAVRPTEQVWDVTCFWLGKLMINSSDVMVAHAWSTCGDQLELHTSAAATLLFRARVNTLSLVLIVTTVLPMLYGTYSQFTYTHNSRARTMWMSSLQLYTVVFWIALDLSILSWFMSRTAPTLHALSLLFYLGLMTMMGVGMLFSSIYAEVMRFEEAPQRAVARFKCVLAIAVMYWAGSVMLEVMSDVVMNSVVVELSTVLFFAPQAYHSFRLGNWTGLTVPFLCGCATLILSPLLATAALTVPPWGVSQKKQTTLLCAALIVAMETFLLVLFRVTKGRHLLPIWMTPWRYVYQTTVEKQRDLIAANPGCPICCSTLIENWSEHDQLWITPCHHLFHKSCLERWMMERMECPLCRTLLPDPE